MIDTEKLDRAVARLPAWRRHGRDYALYDPLADESKLECREVTLRQARKNYMCYGLTGKQDHGVQAGDFYRHEKALVDGSFWGVYRLCLGCMDAFIEGRC